MINNFPIILLEQQIRKERLFMHTYEIIGYLWNLEKTFFHWDTKREFPHFALEEKKTFSCKANSLMEAWLWMLKNNPLYSIGVNIKCQETGDFFCDAILDYYYLNLGTQDINKIVEENIIRCNENI